MSTLEALQRLSDGQFHRLGDEILRRLDLRYRRLRPHGVNDKGESIKGKPDSYVGETAESCTVAVCYTVQRRSWWTKVVSDVRETIAACPSCDEIVFVIPYNVDRNGPKRKDLDWRLAARAAASPAAFRIVDGRELSSLLDTDLQDIRHTHLRIPYSRLSLHGLLESARGASEAALYAIRETGQYDPDRYAARFADGELYRLWQHCLRNVETPGRQGRARLIALVNDSGLGKTSLVCSFAVSLGAVLPVVLLQARDVAFSAEDALVTHVVHLLQGVLDPTARLVEEAAVVHYLAGSAVPLTVIVDALDEARDPDAVRQAVTFWLGSRLGQASTLVATCRPDFWRRCSDRSWKHWMSQSAPDDRSPTTIARPSGQMEQDDPQYGIRLPGRFTGAELEAAWARGGLPLAELHRMSSDAREELRHPFTLRIYLDLRSARRSELLRPTREDLMEQWLDHRLDAEVRPSDRISRGLFQQALRLVAVRIAASPDAMVSVDDLVDVPRFDPADPPGPLVRRMIEAGILETVPRQPGHIRFTVEAVQDYYQADADLENIRRNTAGMAQHFSRLRFTDVSPRLPHIARHIRNDEIRHLFVAELASVAPRMAAVIIAVDPSGYRDAVRLCVADALGQEIGSRYRVVAASAISALRALDCPEAVKTLTRSVLPPADPHPYIKAAAAEAFTRLGHVPAAEFVYKWASFGPYSAGDGYYFRDTLSLLRGAPPAFRAALSVCAGDDLASASGTREHAKAVCALAYLGDKELESHLRSRLNQNGLLESYENHALVALGSDASGALFVESVVATAQRLSVLHEEPANASDRSSFVSRVHLVSYDIRYLISLAFAAHILRLIDDLDPMISWIGRELAHNGLIGQLLYPAALASITRPGWHGAYREDHRAAVTSEVWLQWWRGASDIKVRRVLLDYAPMIPSAEVEEVLLNCLDVRDLRRRSAWLLGEYGSIRAAPDLRNLVCVSDTDERSLWDKEAAARALGCLRDAGAVIPLRALAIAHPATHASRTALITVGLIGTPEAERVLRELLDVVPDSDLVVEGLIACGTSSAMRTVIDRARQGVGGARWLCERVRQMAFAVGWRRGEYYTHIETAELVEYLLAAWEPGTPEENRHSIEAFRGIDSSSVRRLLRTWASEYGEAPHASTWIDDQRRMSDMCNRELSDRGDEFAIPYVLSQWTQEADGYYVALVADDLRSFSSRAVAEELKLRLAAASERSQVIRMLWLLGEFGSASEAEAIRGFLEDDDDLIANVACESLLRLNDPLLVPEHWRGL